MSAQNSLIPRKAGEEWFHLVILLSSLGVMILMWSVGPEEARCWGVPIEMGDAP